MDHRNKENHVQTADQLLALYGDASEASIKKQISYLHPLYQTIINASPFVVLATSGENGLDISPRGDSAGFVEIADEHTLLLPDRRGNNRIDSLRNIIQNPHVALLFLVPGLGETLRVNGTAMISTDPELLHRFNVNGKLPTTVLVITVETVFFQCSRAIHRSGLWNTVPDREQIPVPSPGKILSVLSNAEFDGEKYDRELPERIKSTLY
ncbi:MAG: pyridoxamine 5'-phosphate oxidase family protein [Chitinophagaceae bacterium]|nr:MAG: pyridoxamine 5'-phosphate oxidase family protein [Chitinophagaceae bacterium]